MLHPSRQKLQGDGELEAEEVAELVIHSDTLSPIRTERIVNTMTEQAAPEPDGGADLEADVDAVVEACGGSQRAAIRALLIANEYLSAEVERLKASRSRGYVRGR
jgi:hypothetical protein